MQRSPINWLSSTLIALLPLISIAAEDTAFCAGVTWDNNHALDRGRLMGNFEDLGNGLKLSEGYPERTTRSIVCPKSPKGFNPSLTLSRFIPKAPFSSALRIPSGDEGGQARQGIELWWGGGRVMGNMPGEDFVVFESGDLSTGPDAWAMRAYIATSGKWSDWFFQNPERHVQHSAGNVLFITAVDLSDFGISAGSAIAAIQVINMSPDDRIRDTRSETVSQGMVLFNSGDSKFAKPYPNFKDLENYERRNLFDPDFLYIAAMHTTYPAERIDAKNPWANVKGQVEIALEKAQAGQ